MGSSQSQFRPFPHANRASCCRLQSERWRHVKITITICKTTPNARGDLCDRRQANRDPRKETTLEKDSKKKPTTATKLVMSQYELSGERKEVEIETAPNDVDKVLGCPD